MLTDRASELKLDLGVTQAEVIERACSGPFADDSGRDAKEAGRVVQGAPSRWAGRPSTTVRGR
ncbi:protein of unknown function [Thiomonas sp. Bio17B3]|nr:hypothetical protein THICB3100040 [Thiomonas sp. CB3]VDY04312.1 protein of unknown function [Thiomonas sp. Bio17B3]VDY08514.1 protein of unknown function [Thiomonas sp. Sup16B3]VDY12559.1 conserved protein of unknown function [Thiomonas sp. OC7]VDY18228.1 protein of unknown function [Thiomonas sp. CB2]